MRMSKLLKIPRQQPPSGLSRCIPNIIQWVVLTRTLNHPTHSEINISIQARKSRSFFGFVSAIAFQWKNVNDPTHTIWIFLLNGYLT